MNDLPLSRSELRAVHQELRVQLAVIDNLSKEIANKRGQLAAEKAGLGKILCEVRERAGISLRTLARQLKFSAAFLSDVERGRRSANQTILDWIRGRCG